MGMGLRYAALLLVAVSTFATAAEPPRKIPVLIVDGQNNHDWPRATAYLKSILESSGLFTVSLSTAPPKGAPASDWDNWRPDFSKFDAVVSNFNGGYKPTDTHWPRDVEVAFEKYV